MFTKSLGSETPADILAIALPQSCLSEELKLIEDEEAGVEKQLQVRVKRYAFPQAWPVEDVGLVYYNTEPSDKKPAIELRYCIVGDRYCHSPSCQNSGCELSRKYKRNKPAPVMEVIHVSYHPAMLKHFDTTELAQIFETEGGQYMKQLSPGTKTKVALEQMIHHSYKGVLKNIFLQSKGMELLLYSSDQFIASNPEERYGCRFLTQEKDRDKIVKARNILMGRLDSPVTIKELARMVAMNECYLKKGFKAMFGTTIYDYFQKERMERARFLLHEKGLPVSEVAVMMGYSCISHFSTAFKKHTGLKPCELLR